MSTISLLTNPSFVENPINQSMTARLVGLIDSNSAQSTEELPEPSPDMPSLRAEEKE
jgi:hypothetical protein